MADKPSISASFTNCESTLNTGDGFNTDAAVVSGCRSTGNSGAGVLSGNNSLVLGSMTGEWLSVMNKLSGDAWFWFGHQGYEYVDLGRVWQAALLVGLILWFVLILRTARPALKTGRHKALISLYVFSTAGIAFFASHCSSRCRMSSGGVNPRARAEPSLVMPPL